MAKRRYARDAEGRFASTGGSARTPQGKGSKAEGVELNGKPMTVGQHRAFVSKQIAKGNMTKESHRALMKQGKDSGQTINYRTELGRQRKPSNRVNLGNGYTARSRIVTGKKVNGEFVANENPPKWKQPAKPRTRKRT